MIVSIHQPQYLPWLGYFEKMARADVFVFLDDVQFTKNDWQNRNKARTSDGWHWLTVPILHRLGQTIRETQTDERSPWRQKHQRTLDLSYKKAPYYRELQPDLSRAYDEKETNLSALCLTLIGILAAKLGLTTRTVRSSELGLPTAGPLNQTDRTDQSDSMRGKAPATHRLVEICKLFHADTYYAGAHGRHYMDMDVFDREKISVIFQDYQHPTYRQCFEPFVSNMSVVDLMFNEGPRALEIIRSGATRQGAGAGD